MFGGTALKNGKFHLKENLMGWNQVILYSPSPASSIGLLDDFHKIPIKVVQPVLGLHIISNFTEKKINMTLVNMSKSGPSIFVNS